MIGRDHIRRLTEVTYGARVVAVTDIDAALAARVAADTGARALATGAEVVADPEVDAVVVTSWGPTHAEHVLNAVAAGKPVFCEKPLATDPEDCLRIVEAEMAHGSRLVQVGFMRRYDAGYRELRRIVEGGAIGPALLVHCAHRNAGSPPWYTTEMAALDTAVHEIDVLRWLLDDEIVTTQVIVPRSTGRGPAGLKDPQFMLFETASGTRIDLEVFVNCQYGYDIACEIVGETGLARLPDPARALVRTGGESRTAVVQDWKERFSAAFDVEFQEWVASVAAGRATGPSAWDGYAATVITRATVESLDTGRVVPVDMKDRPEFYA
jgi:myo-inositol 2-dehydrogenase/D-chiro-inositol 1-dehydrogenase